MIKTSELIGAQLDWAVATCEGYTNLRKHDSRGKGKGALTMDPTSNECDPTLFYELSYSSDWSMGGPIIEREWLHPTPWPNQSDEDLRWSCTQHDATEPICERGPTPLIAAMRCYVASKFGDEVDIPEELL